MKKAFFKKIASAAAVIFVAIQFVQPARNQSGQALDTDIANVVAVPYEVQGILATACFDCHSNNTRYPFYAYVQPGGWFMAYHVRSGKAKLNFSEFGAYSKRRQGSKLESIARQIEDDAMPLRSYRWLHPSAGLSQTEKDAIVHWASAAQDSLSNNNLK